MKKILAVVVIFLGFALSDLQVLADVTFEDTPTNVTAIVGETVTLPCIINGMENTNAPVLWINKRTSLPYSVGRNIFTSDSRIQLTQANSIDDWSLMINDVDLSDQNIYTCSVYTKPRKSQDISLTILSPPKIVNSSEYTETVNTGESIELTCLVEGVPPPVVFWYEFGLRDRIKVGTSETLLIQNITGTVEGVYRGYREYECVVANGVEPTLSKLFRVDVHAVPSIELLTASDSIVSIGRNVTMTISCTGNPPPFVDWVHSRLVLYRNNVRYIFESRNESIHSLTITGINLDEFGFYRVVCVNSLGRDGAVFQIKQFLPPEIDLIRSSGNQSVHLGDSLELSCYTTSGNAAISWYKAEDIESNRDVPVGTGNTLAIPFVQTSDAGLYVCLTGNTLGFSTHHIAVTIQARPALETTPLNITAKRGFSVTLPCSINNLGTHRVMWMSQYNVAITIDDRIILPDSRYSLERAYDKDWGLVINNVKSTDEGVYRCVVNSFPVLEKQISLIVLVSPSIDSQMTSNNMAVSEMDDVTLRCHVTGNPKPDITWYRRVSGADHQDLVRERLEQTGNILNIPQIDRHSAGEYICHASNGIEPSASKNITVDVLYAPEIQTMMRNMGQYLGRDSTLECTAEGSPIPDMKWYINGQRLIDSWKFKTTNYVEPLDGVVTSALLIRNIDRMDYTVYTCEAENAHGTALHNITVFPLGSPEIIIEQSSRDMIVREGTEIDLECFASGTPTPTVTWSKNDGQTEIGPGTVTLTNVQASDAGTYTCFAENPLGSDTLSIQIDVEYSPTVSVQSSEYEFVQGEMVSINCTVKGRPQPQMSWRKEDSSEDSTADITELNESTWIMTLRIDIVTSDDFGGYLCEAVNSANSSSSLIQLIELQTTTIEQTIAPTTPTTTLPPTTPKPATTIQPQTTTIKKDNIHNPAEEIKATSPKSNEMGTESPLGGPNSSSTTKTTGSTVLLVIIALVLLW
ncbi:hemicentin-1-like [Ylistrum balloti]|uniref:hemicentin-1-like n=1 Tax=Ylistrum balloti TaxID=509963 RepID=UPI002905D69B|nr:hemicentin-1-like [Ylistrum balloti]